MKKDNELKQFSWIHTKVYSLILKFFYNTFVVEQFIQKIEFNKKILEIGSGTGHDYKKLREKYNITGSDYSDSFLQLLNKKFKNDKFLKLNALSMDIDEKFDVIYSNKVLHHLTPEQLKISLENQYNCLNENGLLFHALWQGSVKKSAPKEMPDVKYEFQDIEILKGKFKIKEFITYKERSANDSFIVILEK